MSAPSHPATLTERTFPRFCVIEPSRLGHQVILFWDAGGPASSNAVVLDGAFKVTSHLEQVSTDRVETIMTGKSSVGIEGPQQFQTFRGAVYHSNCNGVIKRHNGTRRHVFQELVQSKDLRPVRVLRSGCFVMNCSDSRLQLIQTHRSFR